MTNLANNIVGVKGKYTFVPVWDETNDCAANFYYPTTSNSMTALYKTAVQPNLIYILHRVLELEGYKIIKDEYDVYPWNTLYIASAFKTCSSVNVFHTGAHTLLSRNSGNYLMLVSSLTKLKGSRYISVFRDIIICCSNV